MTWVRGTLIGLVVVALLGVGALADRALVEQAAMAEQAEFSKLDETARLTALSVRATLTRVEQGVVSGEFQPGVMVCELARRSAPSGGRGQPYGKRPRADLLSLTASRSLTPNGLPEAVVAAIALDEPEAKRSVSGRLLTGLIPLRGEDVPFLASSLGFAGDPRVAHLSECLRRADAESERVGPEFARVLAGEILIAASATPDGVRRYELAAVALLDLAGVGDRATLYRGGDRQDSTRRVIDVPDVAGLALAVEPHNPLRLRIRALRIVLWMAIVTSFVGLAAVLRGVTREAHAVAREKRMLASMTHEMRSPLAAIRLFGETLAQGRGNPAEYGELVAQESARLDTLVEQALSIARIDEAPSFALVKPADIADSAIAIVEARAKTRSVVIDWTSPQEHVPDAYWDGDGVRRALVNLLDNAVKHGKPAGCVALTLAVQDETVRFAVADDGPGIGWRDRRRIFGRFERGTTESQGTGLGLYMVETVARAHGGRVDLRSEEGRGCTFTLVLPLGPPGAAASAVTAWSHGE